MKKVIIICILGIGIVFLVPSLQTKAVELFYALVDKSEKPNLVVIDTPLYPASDIGHVVPDTATISFATEAKVEEMAVQKTPEKAQILICPKGNTLSLDAMLYPMSKSFSIADEYIPEDLVRVPATYVKNDAFICVTTDTLSAIEKMFDAALVEGYTLYVTSGFRSSATQKTLFDYYTELMGLLEAERRSAYPGHSEHQLGTTIDITGGTIPSTSQVFGVSPEGVWVSEHAGEYGFVLSYDEGKEEVTGYMYEPWHFRYVGKEVAEDVTDEEVTLGEYLLELYHD